MSATSHLAHPAVFTLPNQIRNPPQTYTKEALQHRENCEIFIRILTSKASKRTLFHETTLTDAKEMSDPASNHGASNEPTAETQDAEDPSAQSWEAESLHSVPSIDTERNPVRSRTMPVARC
jgi:hypothetical protein